ncbi:hypothetical protein C5B85_18210 [Pseudoclavibacter sp. AY1F1]|uniref:hypothetical protein n=1 Tax=Pseudoclavibacter sp. AY1F1 TaxID=2080583 RepID=UPI000CE797FC|nr:hypothetical protein [Pseudoclavibacter sp. AY1F1]PPF41855.1 hypothetical protein C5B85_18210 [Pseudoclavibacter sp. AY1F1]
MAASLNGDAGSYEAVLDGARVAQFLATQNWTIQSDLGYAQVWSEPGAVDKLIRRILIPKDPTLDDYKVRLSQALSRISETYAWSLADLAEQIAAVSADLFFVRVDQHMTDGTIPLRQASALLESIDDMIRSAALTTANPLSTGRGRMPTLVNDFLNDDVRMGHTKRGSFIITVAARLDSPADAASSAEPGSVAVKATTQRAASFTRQVMTTLARTLEVTKQVAESSAHAPDFDQAMETGMRLPMVKALQSMGSSEGLRSLDMSFEWAPIEPQREAVEDKIDMSRETVLLLDRISERLVRKDPPKDLTITGPVVELRRGAESESVSDGRGAGEVVLRADIDGSWRKVGITLSGTDYDWAIEAHRKKLPLTAGGVLEKVGRSWVLSEPVLDTAFLEFQAAQAAGMP